MLYYHFSKTKKRLKQNCFRPALVSVAEVVVVSVSVVWPKLYIGCDNSSPSCAVSQLL